MTGGMVVPRRALRLSQQVLGRRKIFPTELEDRLFQLIRRVRPDGNVRIAGGWVRDKLLGKSTTDVDIALEDETGKRFADDLIQTYNAEEDKDKSVILLQKRPDQSKHLETAMFQLYGMEIDAVNLRTETYADPNSRVPSAIQFGAPEEDALRRDFTVNSLFYNLRTEAVEDFTGKGLEDLNKRLLRTPIDPSITLADDPLRLLRGIRFSCQLDFELSEDFQSAAQCSSIHENLKRKVSSERISQELLKTLKTGRASKGIKLIHDFGIGDTVFGEGYDPGLPERFKEAEDILKEKFADLSSSAIDDPRLQVLVTSIFLKTSPKIADKILRESLRFPRSLVASCQKSLLHFRGLQDLLLEDSLIAWKMRFWFYSKKDVSWMPELTLARISLGERKPSIPEFEQFLDEHSILAALQLRPLVGGAHITTRVGRSKQASKVISAMVQWQCEYPDATIGDAHRWLDEYLEENKLS